ncbi:Fanconi anemia group J protein homolog isoform X2 [Temnothorax longispinosus]|uniref:DNA 5'-3' helicase n=1 Tax=Temnothorax longispinosus TaxID=300112 RepID=A0A4V3SA13_9HYME|nr:Uncharacterized protein DBV15_04181 [Temnothorax longispinosus]
MIAICVIFAVIGLFVCALLKARLDEWLEDSSMRRLSLKRSGYCNQAQGTLNDPVEISDDDSFDSLNIEENTKACMNVTCHEAANVSNSVTDAAKCNSKHDISDDLDSEEDVTMANAVSENIPKSQSMFNWNKSIFATDILHQNVFPESSGTRNAMPEEIPNKRQKLMKDLKSSDDLSCSEDEIIYLSPKKDDSPPQVRIQHERMIAGVKVKFPVKPYPCQMAVMNSLIVGCTKEQNCLLESPTGSGKTLALLCGALAWQEQFSEKIFQGGDGMDTDSPCCNDDSLNENFFLNPSQYFDEEMVDKISSKNKIRRVPKVYYGTRTHKQIEQVVREFKKTAYRHKRMTILSSRKQTCIQQTKRDKNELCNELLDPRKGKTCPYYNDRSRIRGDSAFKSMKTPWDIEDLVSLGKSIDSCPYFGARSLMATAEIIFCPYNYILDPDIRESMQINLKGDIVILDEAHNIEDMCRDAASVNLRDDEITNAVKDCKHLLSKGHEREHAIYDTIQNYLMDIVKFLQNIEVRDNGSDREMISNTWLGMEFRVLLDVNNVGCSRFPNFLAATREAIEDFNKNMKEPEKMILTISQETKRILEHVCLSMQMIVSDILVDDYRMCVIETIELTKNVAPEDTWIKPSFKPKVKVRTMKLICMNPAIVFAPLARTVRSMIVTSGTLTPTTSFQSELGTQFPHIVNPNHIIPKEQVYVRCISRGPKGIALKAVYEKVGTYDFQDELGNLILQVCDSVPYGVLCFFSSYTTMNKIHERWEKLGILKKLSDLKEIFMEPQKNEDLPTVMRNYRRVIEESSSKSFRTACGAILFAVYRGKVAEGIDFSDNEARCVLAIGIPYKPCKNNDINMKMRYNDSKVSKGLLSGSEWYGINAFRAVNQAIGRCVRHIGDWGAVLLVDERYQSRLNHLPKWIKTSVRCNNDYDLEIELQDFVAMQAARERGEKCIEN